MNQRAARAATAAALTLGTLTACGGASGDGTGGGGEAGQATGGTGVSDPESSERPLELVKADTTAEVAAIIKKVFGPCIQMHPDDHPMPSSKEGNTCVYEDGSSVASLQIDLIDNTERERLHLKADSVGYLLYGEGFMIDFETPQQQQALEAAGLLYLNCEDGFDAYVKANEGVKTIRTVKATIAGCRYTETDLTRFM
ncbi:hypothetical protein ACWY4P_50135 [Streptomyces sp. LZ34]